jgi:hypothetical protein
MKDPSLIHAPGLDTSVHGLNDYRKPLYRVIWAASRSIRLHGPAGIVYRKLYERIEPVCDQSCTGHLPGEHWIIERWKSALEATGGLSKAQWRRDPIHSLNDYPERGDYYRCWTFSGQPTPSAVMLAIQLLEQSARRGKRRIDNTLAIVADSERIQRERDNQFEARVRDAMIPWAAQPVSSARFSKGTKTAKEAVPRGRMPAPGTMGVAKRRTGVNVLVGDGTVRARSGKIDSRGQIVPHGRKISLCRSLQDRVR